MRGAGQPLCNARQAASQVTTSRRRFRLQPHKARCSQFPRRRCPGAPRPRPLMRGCMRSPDVVRVGHRQQLHLSAPEHHSQCTQPAS